MEPQATMNVLRSPAVERPMRRGKIPQKRETGAGRAHDEVEFAERLRRPSTRGHSGQRRRRA